MNNLEYENNLHNNFIKILNYREKKNDIIKQEKDTNKIHAELDLKNNINAEEKVKNSTIDKILFSTECSLGELVIKEKINEVCGNNRSRNKIYPRENSSDFVFGSNFLKNLKELK